MSKIAVAYSNTVLRECEHKGIYISPLKLQKLIYLSYGTSLKNGKNTMPALLRFEAWEYGPVLPQIYRQYRHRGSRIVDALMNYQEALVFLKDRDDVREAVNLYGKYDGMQLVRMVHQKNGAWYPAYTNEKNNILDHNLIAQEFSQ